MKVLHFLDTVNRGGTETQVLDVCRNAREFGIDITFVTAQGGPLEENFRESGVEFIKLGRRFPVDLYLASQLRRIIKDRNIEIVHGHQAVEGLHLYLASRGLKNVRRVLNFHGGTVHDWKNRRTTKFLIPRMHLNIAVSHCLKKLHAEVDRYETSNFVVLSNGADPARLKPTGKDLRKELGIAKGSRLAGMIGNFYAEDRKDQLTVCRALPKVFEAHPDVHMVFAGKVDDGAEDKFADCLNFCLKHRIADRVHFLGGRGDIPDVLAALDVFVLSSFKEGLPVSVSEAMVVGLPLVLSDIEPLLEVSDGGRCAEIFKTGSAAQLADRLTKLFGDEDHRRERAVDAHAYGMENYSIEAHLKGLRAIYERLLSAED